MNARKIPLHESLTVEFKSDRGPLPEKDLLLAVVCMANSDGGMIYLGVERDGTVTGVNPEHRTGMAEKISARTLPPLRVVTSVIEVDGIDVLAIEVPVSPQVISTSNGTIRRRRLDTRGEPECVALDPRDFPSRLSHFGLHDLSALPVAGAEIEDLDPLQRARLRQFIEKNDGEKGLLRLDDAELDGALGLTVRDGDERLPTLTGILLAGRLESIRRLVPTHEVAFQILDVERVRLNEFRRTTLVESVEWLETLFTPLNIEEEIEIGMFREPIPKLPREAYREAIANALIHRDYGLPGAIHVRMEGDTLTVSNPGGLVEGVSIDNLLTTEPRPRNPLLADACKRIGMVERTGRGIDKIYRGVLRYGRRFPDYGLTTSSSVVLQLYLGEPDLFFLRLIQEQEGPDRRLPIDSLIALSRLYQQKRLTVNELADLIQKGPTAASRTLETLVEAGLAQRQGTARTRSYTLSPQVYRRFGSGVEYTRQAGFDRIQQEEMVIKYVREHGSIARSDAATLCQLDPKQASRLLGNLVKRNKLIMKGNRRTAHYRLPEK